jgi:cardiolipin synthase
MKMTNLPNTLTILRIAAVPAIVLLAVFGGQAGSYPAAAVFIAAGLTDWLDGFLARRLKQESVIGAILDPIADKFQVSITLLVLLWLGALPGWNLIPALAILGREIIVSGLREGMASKNMPRISSSFAAKSKTVFQMAALTILLVGTLPGSWAPQVGYALLWFAALMSIWTGFIYLRTALVTLR